jgi:GntR family transcriptional regulator
MRELGLIPGSRVLELRAEEASEHVRKVLRLSDNQSQVTKLMRVRLANDEPILLETTYIPVYLCPGLTEYDFEQGSLYQTFDEQYHLNLEYAEEHYEIALMKPNEAELLQCGDNTCAFSIERIAFLETNRPVEYTRAIGRGDRLHFTVKLVRNADTPFRRKIEI